MSPPLVASLLYIAVFGLMLTAGAGFQFVHPQFGLIASEAVCILGPAVFVAVLIRKNAKFPSTLSVKRWGLSAKWTAWLVLASVLLAFSANAASALFTELVPGLKELAEKYEVMVQSLMYPESMAARIAAVTAVVVMAPLCEETLFRGVMLPLHRARKMSLAAALLINGLLFSLLHVNPVTFPALVVVGAFFAHVGLLSRSLWPCVAAHAILNFMNGVVGMELMRKYETLDEPSITMLIGATVLLGLPFLIVWFVGWRGLSSEETADA